MQELFDHKKIIRIEDDTWMGTLVKANYLIAIFNAPSEEELRVKLETCAEKIPN